MTERIIPKISIITVVMDDLAGFKVTAASIFAQENRALEWVIVDGSKSDEIFQYLSNNRFNSISISYLKEAPNGIYAAMNTG